MEIDQSLSDILSKEEITKFCCKNFLKDEDEGLEVISYEYTNIGGTPKGFLGKHRFLNVLINRKTKTGENTQDKLKFFIKSTPNDVSAQMEYCEGFGVFEKETNVYKYVLPLLMDINIGNNRSFAPKCYFVNREILIFENLMEQGYRLGTKHGGILDYDHLLCALKTLAILHSASIVWEYRTKQKIVDTFSVCVEENSYPSDPQNLRTILFEKAVAALLELLKAIPKYQNSSNLNHITDTFPSVLKKIFEFCKPSKRFRNVFSHGDLWANNLMFKYENYNGKNIPIDCRLVDFQLVRYSPPIVDVITVLSIPTSSEFRRKYLDNLLQKYYKFLTENLAEHNIAIENVISIAEYNASIEHYKLVGIIESCLFSHLTILPEDMVSNILTNTDKFDEFLRKSRSEVCLNAFQNDEMYRERMTDMISEVVDNFILKEDTKL